MSAYFGGKEMIVQRNSYGIVISVIVHILILAIPITVPKLGHFKEVELFIIDERFIEPKVKKSLISPMRTESFVPKVNEQSIKEVKEIAEPTVNSDMVETGHKITEVMEPVRDLQDENVKTMQPALVLSMPEINKPLQPEVKPDTYEDVEFGSPIGPSFKHMETPVYPLLARRLGKEGRVLLRLTIDEKGKLLNVEVIEGAGFGFTEAAVEAIKKSTFLPAIKDGRPVKSKALLPIRFTLRRDK